MRQTVDVEVEYKGDKYFAIVDVIVETDEVGADADGNRGSVQTKIEPITVEVYDDCDNRVVSVPEELDLKIIDKVHKYLDDMD